MLVTSRATATPPSHRPVETPEACCLLTPPLNPGKQPRRCGHTPRTPARLEEAIVTGGTKGMSAEAAAATVGGAPPVGNTAPSRHTKVRVSSTSTAHGQPHANTVCNRGHSSTRRSSKRTHDVTFSVWWDKAVGEWCEHGRAARVKATCGSRRTFRLRDTTSTASTATRALKSNSVMDATVKDTSRRHGTVHNRSTCSFSATTSSDRIVVHTDKSNH